MFLKPFRIKTQTAVKGSDRKKLRADIKQQFPCLSSAEVDELIPGKGDMSQIKIATHSDDHFIVYCSQKNPIFFETFRKLFPTVYTLWKFPDLLPGFTTYPEVFNKLFHGADLMLPGVEVKGEPHPRMFGNLQKGDLCLVRLKGNRAPVLLGETLLSGEDMYMSAMKGKGVRTLHILGDQLWVLGDKSQPPVIPDDQSDGNTSDKEESDIVGDPSQATEGIHQDLEKLSLQEKVDENSVAAAVESADGDTVSDNNDGDAGSDNNDDAGVVLHDNQDEGVENGDDESEILGQEEMDELLHFCFKCAIKGRIHKSDLPLLTSALLKGYMQPFCAPSKHLDLKKSSYKKFSKFLQQMESEGFIKLREISKGVDTITEIDRSHPELRGLTVPEIVENSSQQEEEKFEPPKVTEVLFVTGATLPLLAAKGYKKGSMLTATVLRQIVTDYVQANKLQIEDEKDHVLLDPVLSALALAKSEGGLSQLTWSALFNRIAEKLQSGCLIEYAGKEPILRKGKIGAIQLDVKQRGSRKKVTTVQNLEDFGIDPHHFAQVVQRKVAGSASVTQSEEKNRGLEVQVQGNQVAFITQHLLETYKIPWKYLAGTEKAPRPKRR